jgi:outer membrane protein assembly factor BamB
VGRDLVSAGATIVATAISVALITAQEWPQWRGPTRDGVSVSSVPSTWPERLTRAWTAHTGEGLSSPVVSRGLVFVLSRENDEETIRALDLKTGAERWKDRYAAPYEVLSEAAIHGKRPRATPLVANGRLVTFGISGVLSSYDAQTGKLAWRRQTSEPFEQRAMIYGSSASPIVERDVLVVPVGHERAGAVVAFDQATGAERWRWSGGSPS